MGLSRGGAVRPASARATTEESASCHVFVWVKGLVQARFYVVVPVIQPGPQKRQFSVKFLFAATGDAQRSVQQVPAVSETDSRKRRHMVAKAATSKSGI